MANRLLLIEKNSRLKRLLNGLLLGMGYQVRQEPDFNAGLKHLSDFKPDIVLLGLPLQEEGGCQVLKEKGIPCILMGDKEQIKALGPEPLQKANASLLVSRPFRAAQLLVAIADCQRKSSSSEGPKSLPFRSGAIFPANIERSSEKLGEEPLLNLESFEEEPKEPGEEPSLESITLLESTERVQKRRQTGPYLFSPQKEEPLLNLESFEEGPQKEEPLLDLESFEEEPSEGLALESAATQAPQQTWKKQTGPYLFSPQKEQPKLLMDEIWSLSREGEEPGSFLLLPMKPQSPNDPSGIYGEKELSELLFLCFRDLFTGRLLLQQGKLEKEIFIVQGRPVGAMSNQQSESLGHLLFRKGILDENLHRESVEWMQREGIRQGEAVIKMGLISEDDLELYLEMQSKQRIMSCFELRGAEYGLSYDPELEERKGNSALNPLVLVFDGIKEKLPPGMLIRHFDTYNRRICRLTERLKDYATLLKDYAYELRLTELCDGKQTLGEILSKSGYGLLDTLRVLRALEVLQCVQFGSPRQPSHHFMGGPVTHPRGLRSIAKSSDSEEKQVPSSKSLESTPESQKPPRPRMNTEERRKVSAWEALNRRMGRHQEERDPRVIFEQLKDRLEESNLYEFIGVEPGSSQIQLEALVSAQFEQLSSLEELSQSELAPILARLKVVSEVLCSPGRRRSYDTLHGFPTPPEPTRKSQNSNIPVEQSSPEGNIEERSRGYSNTEQPRHTEERRSRANGGRPKSVGPSADFSVERVTPLSGIRSTAGGQRAKRRAPTTGPQKRKNETVERFERAKALLEEEPSRALKEFEFLVQERDRPLFRMYWGWASFLNADPKDKRARTLAHQTIKSALLDEPGLELGYLFLAKIYQQVGNMKMAQKLFRKALSLNPQNAEILAARGEF